MTRPTKTNVLQTRAVLLTAMGTLVMLTGALSGPVAAQQCKPEDVSAVIDGAGAQLRELNTQAQPRIQGKLRELAAAKGWNNAELERQGRALIDDAATRAFDERAATLLAGLDRMAQDGQSNADSCERLAEARAQAKELVALTAARTDHVVARLDGAMKPAQAAAAAAAPPAQPQATQPPPPQSPQPPVATREPVTKQANAAPPAPPRPKAAPPTSAWETQTVRESDIVTPPAAVVTLPPPPDPGSFGYSPEEIQAAGRGVFGTISAGLASVIDFAFQKYGKPTGYVLGDEGGGAFFAGLRYGEGRLVTKLGGDRKVYWQGPSAGFDFGLAGSRVMFLVYSIEDHQELFQRFTGVDGSAYLVGGAGITLLKRGKVILAPIRTGLGLRVGASVGYLKFTPTPTLNPF